MKLLTVITASISLLILVSCTKITMESKFSKDSYEADLNELVKNEFLREKDKVLVIDYINNNIAKADDKLVTLSYSRILSDAKEDIQRLLDEEEQKQKNEALSKLKSISF